MLDISHLAAFVQSMGGVQSVVRRHLNNDANYGLHTGCISCFERTDASQPLVQGLGLNWLHTIATARTRFESVRNTVNPNILIYHNLWGLPFFSEVDQSCRRIGILHTDWPGFDRVLPMHRGLLDGVLCVSQPLVELAKHSLPELGQERIQFIPLPIDIPYTSIKHTAIVERPLRIGICGRIEIPQKRMDRLPDLCRLLSAHKERFQIELLGDGPAKTWLQTKVHSNKQVRFLGHRQGKDYWATLAQWDVILFLSDFEGLPIALLEAMSQGVIPLFPEIHCGGDEYANAISSSLVYPPGNLTALHQALRKIHCMPPDTIEILRQRCKELVTPHSSNQYHQVFGDFVKRIYNLARISKKQFGPRPFHWSDYCPFGILKRIYRKGFFR